jgi:hypothetical protein
MMGRSSKRATLLLIAGLVAASRAVAEDSPLGLADLEAYRVALASKPVGSAPMVRFRDLWDRPGDHAGKSVSVEGRVARTFRQPGFGEFPPLVEAWILSPAGDPFCLVFPQTEATPIPEIGSPVRFSGTFLKRIKYQGGDVPRLAPLIVGPVAPSTSYSSPETVRDGWSSTDWMMALGASLVVALILAGRHLSRPAPISRAIEPPPAFVDGKPETEGYDA